MTELNPGSPEAMAAGCKCPRIDNHNGAGWMGKEGIFVMNSECPLHGQELKQKLAELRR